MSGLGGGEMDPEEAASLVSDAVTRGVMGDMDGGLETIQPIYALGPLMAFRLTAALASIAAEPARLMSPNADGFGAVAVQVDQETGVVRTMTTDELPPVERAGARILSSIACGDLDTAIAVFRTVREEGPADVAELVCGMFLHAAEATQFLMSMGRGEAMP